MASLGLLLSIVFPSVFSAPVVATSPPPPPPSPPGIGCSGEQVFTTSSGSASVTFTAGTARVPALVCTFLIHTTAPSGLTLSSRHFSPTATANEPQGQRRYIRVYDGTTKLARMLASYRAPRHECGLNRQLDPALLRKMACTAAASPFRGSRPAMCGNGVCEASSDEYDTCSPTA